MGKYAMGMYGNKCGMYICRPGKFGHLLVWSKLIYFKVKELVERINVSFISYLGV
jgi:hypothetical protein